MTDQLIECKTCKKEVSKKAKTCPHCGQSNPGINISGKDISITILFFILIAGVFIFFDDPALVNRAKDEILVHYIDNEIYSPTPVECNTEKVNDEYYVYCTPFGGKVGGLYLVRYNSDEVTYKIFTLNVNASQHAEKGLKTSILNEDKDIPEILKQF